MLILSFANGFFFTVVLVARLGVYAPDRDTPPRAAVSGKSGDSVVEPARGSLPL